MGTRTSRGGTETIGTSITTVTMDISAGKLSIINDGSVSVFVRKNSDTVTTTDDVEIKADEAFDFGYEGHPVVSFSAITASSTTTIRWAVE